MKKGMIKIKVKYLINLFVYIEDIYQECQIKSEKNQNILGMAEPGVISDLIASYGAVSEFTNVETFCQDLTPAYSRIMSAFCEENFYLGVVVKVFNDYKKYFNSIEEIVKLNNAISYFNEEDAEDQIMKKMLLCEKIMDKEIFVLKNKMQPVFDFQKKFQI